MAKIHTYIVEKRESAQVFSKGLISQALKDIYRDRMRIHFDGKLFVHSVLLFM